MCSSDDRSSSGVRLSSAHNTVLGEFKREKQDSAAETLELLRSKPHFARAPRGSWLSKACRLRGPLGSHPPHPTSSLWSGGRERGAEGLPRLCYPQRGCISAGKVTRMQAVFQSPLGRRQERVLLEEAGLRRNTGCVVPGGGPHCSVPQFPQTIN